MPKTLRQKLLLALIALLLIVAGYYWNVGLELFNEQPTRPGQDNTIDYYAENAHSLQYQEDGSLDYEMTAVKLEHQKATDITFVTTPDLLLFRGNVQPWHIQSARAEVGPKGKEVELIDDVRVARTDAKGQPSILTTTRLTVFPDKNYAQTEQAVKIVLDHLGLVDQHDPVLRDEVLDGQAIGLGHVLTLKQDKNGDIEVVTSVGKPAYYEQKPAPDKDVTKAYGLTIQYFVTQNRVVLIDQAKVIQEGNTFEGEKIVYDTQRQIVNAGRATGSQVTSPRPRIDMVIQPKKKAQ